MTRTPLAWMGALSLAACGGQADVGAPPPGGETGLSSPAGGFDGAGRWQEAAEGAAVRTPSSFTVWVGQVELQVSNALPGDDDDPWSAFQPERLTLVLGHDARGTALGGTLTFGRTAPPPPPDDPGGWYPPGHSVPSLVPPIWPGFEYPLRSLLASKERLGFSLAPGDVFTAWCALQTAHAVRDPRGFACAEGPPLAPSEVPAASPRDVMCRGPAPACACDASGCREDAAFRIQFEVAMDGDRALGRVLGRAGFWDLSLTLVDEITFPLTGDE